MNPTVTDALPTIPTPPAQRWREFRMQVLPVITFLSMLVMLVILWSQFIQPIGLIGEVQPIRVNVVSLGDGVLVEVAVDLFEEVKEGQEIGRVLAYADDAGKSIEKAQPLRAPMDGRVSMLLKMAGETVMRGEPLITISAQTSDRVVGYLPQPINTVPTTNDVVKLRTRSHKRVQADCRIIQVGAALEPIKSAMLPPDKRRVATGLPILIALPSNLRLVPGEYVDLAIQSNR